MPIDKGLFDEFFKPSEESIEKILVALLDKDNVSMKTEIQQPLNLTRLDALALWLKAEKMNQSAKFVNEFIKRYLEYMVSHNRQSRQEIIQALTEGLKREKSLQEKLTQPPT